MPPKQDAWSPADNPHAIAVSQAQWWLAAARLAARRIQDGDDRRISWSSRPIDAANLVFALRQVRAAASLELVALADLDVDPVVGDGLRKARKIFEDALPGLKHMRDALTHFDEWSQGKGRGPQRDRVIAGEARRDVARAYWGFSYEPATDTVSMGPYEVRVDAALREAPTLCKAIYAAAHEVDKMNVAALRRRTVDALTGAGILVDDPSSELVISPGTDLRIWISIQSRTDKQAVEMQRLSCQVLDALHQAGLCLVHPPQPQTANLAGLLGSGIALQTVPHPGV